MSTRKICWNRDHAIYRAFDSSNNLLYIGISSQPLARLDDHKRYSLWFVNQDRIEIEWVSDRFKALIIEKTAIFNLKPMYNLQHNPRFKQIGRGFVPAIGDGK